MTIYEGIVLSSIIGLPVLLLVCAFIVALGKRPGYRRRQDSGPPKGGERRCEFRKQCLDEGIECCKQPANCTIFIERRAAARSTSKR